MDLQPDPVSVWWAIQDARGVVVDFEIGDVNPAMLALSDVTADQSVGRRLLAESPACRDKEACRTARRVVETGVAVAEIVVDRAAPMGCVALVHPLRRSVRGRRGDERPPRRHEPAAIGGGSGALRTGRGARSAPLAINVSQSARERRETQTWLLDAVVAAAQEGQLGAGCCNA